jgi:hypothetical protein
MLRFLGLVPIAACAVAELEAPPRANVSHLVCLDSYRPDGCAIWPGDDESSIAPVPARLAVVPVRPQRPGGDARRGAARAPRANHLRMDLGACVTG